MKKILFAIQLLAVSYTYAQNTYPPTGNVGIGTNSPGSTLTVNGNLDVGIENNHLIYNGLADVYFRFADRGTGGRAIVHDIGNKLTLNYAGDFNGGIQLGTNAYFTESQSGNSYIQYGNVGIGTSDPLNKFVINAGENSKAIEIGGTNFNGSAGTHLYPAVSFYATKDGVRQAAASSEIVFSDRPGTLNFASNARASDMLFYTAHSYSPAINQYGMFPDLSMVIKSTQNGGYVGIGTATPDTRLAVNGTIHATEVLVDQNIPTPDYVFDEDYDLPSLKDVKAYIDRNHHLSEIPSAAQVPKDGINLGEMNTRLLKKIEELTLYLIKKDEELTKEKLRNDTQQNELNQIKKKLNLN